MPDKDLIETVALVAGADWGFGRGIDTSRANAGAIVVAVARDREALSDLRAQHGDTVSPVVADVTDPLTAGRLIDQYNPDGGAQRRRDCVAAPVADAHVVHIRPQLGPRRSAHVLFGARGVAAPTGSEQSGHRDVQRRCASWFATEPRPRRREGDGQVRHRVLGR